MLIYEEFSSPAKTAVRALAILLLVGLMLSAFGFAYGYFVDAWNISTNNPAMRQISVSGEGKVAARPDIAIFTATIITQAKKVKDSQSENTSKSNAVLAFLKKQGVDEKDIKTAGYFIQPQQQYFSMPPCYAAECPPQKPPVIVGYNVRHSIEIKVRDPNKTDDLLFGVVEQGANEVGSIQFTIDDQEKIKAEARKKAIENAQTKANVLASDLGIRLVKIISFSESGGGIPIYANMALEKGFGGGAAPATPEVQPGEQEIRSFVNIGYEFR